jgi:hypothetical protein
MRLSLIPLLLAALGFAQAQSADSGIHITGSGPNTVISTDFFEIQNTDSNFLQVRFITPYHKGAGLQSITIEAYFISRTDLYKSSHKREFSLIVDGDRVDFGPMLYGRYTVKQQDGKELIYVGDSPANLPLPTDMKLTAQTPLTDSVVGGLDKFIFFRPAVDAFERVGHAKHISLKIGPTRVALNDGQVNMLHAFIRRAIHG